MSAFAESTVESAALGWLAALGHGVKHGPAIAVGEPGAERIDMLLPKRISGEPRLEAAERFIALAASGWPPEGGNFPRHAQRGNQGRAVTRPHRPE